MAVIPSWLLRISRRCNSTLDEFEQRRLEWSETSTRWIDFLHPHPLRCATNMGRGERGVLVMRVDTTDMVDMMAGRLPTGRAAVPLWLSLDEFTALFSQADDLPPGTVQRWASHIQLLDPLKDAVLFLLSTPDGDGRSFSRIIAVRGEVASPDLSR